MNNNNNKSIFFIIITTVIISVATTLVVMFYFIIPHSSSVVSDHNHLEKKLFTCGMHPWIISEEPGNCPICEMKLTPKRNSTNASKTDNLINGVEISIDPIVQQNMGIRLATVKKGPLVHTIRTYGHITYDETRVARFCPKISGWYEKLYVDFTGQVVRKGDPLFEIYSPELLTAQEEYLSAFRSTIRSKDRNVNNLLNSSRRRLLYYDVAKEEIKAIGRSGKIQKSIIIRSPYKGVVTHKNVVQGDYVKAGTTVYTIVDLSTVWVEAHIYEYEINQVQIGHEAEMRLPYEPGKIYKGKVTYIYPYLQQKTRDVVLRIAYSNPNLSLKPDMYADVYVKIPLEKDGLIIPTESVIRSGERNIVFVMTSKGTFSPRVVTVGKNLDDGFIQILDGLSIDEQVVISGQFLLDSESKLKEAVQKMMQDNLIDQSSSSDSEADSSNEDDDFFDDM